MNRYTSTERAKLLGSFVVETGATVRHTATVYGISKSTVHKDLTERLKYIDPALFKKVKCVLDINKAQRHLRGGEATRIKYKKLKKRLI